MDIKSIEDLRKVVGEMHDSEFTDKDLLYNSAEGTFSLKTYTPDKAKEYLLDIYNVKKYEPVNLDKINRGQATGGIFNDVIIKNNGLDLEIISQDLKIKLNVSKLEGSFIQVTR